MRHSARTTRGRATCKSDCLAGSRCWAPPVSLGSYSPSEARGVLSAPPAQERGAHPAARRLSAVPPSFRPPPCSPASGHGSDPPSFTAGRFSPRGVACQA
jgi:hypothetical protein